MADSQAEQHAQDLAEWANLRFAETRSYVRDQFLARQSKEAAEYACQICGDHVEDPAIAQRFVHSHHIEPLSEEGKDVLDNLIVLCPNCHSRVHARIFQIERRADQLHVIMESGQARRLADVHDFQTLSEMREAAAHQHVLHLLERLGPGRRADLLKVLATATMESKPVVRT